MTNRMKAVVAAVVMGAGALQVDAAVIAPVKGYVKPGEPLEVRFLNEKGDEGKKALLTLGQDAAKLDFLFAAAPAGDVMGADGAPAFLVYTSTGELLKAGGAVKAGADGSVDLGAAFPKLKEAGTYYVVWKDAAPLVVQTLRNPIPWAVAKNPSGGMDPRGLIQQFTTGAPVITRMVQAEQAVITTDKGVIKAKFSYEVAPHTIDNFVDLARHGLYNNSAFHRIIRGFMIQGGDSLANSVDRAGSGGPGFNVTAELSDKKHEKGTLSMARMGFSVDTAGGQFFIMHGKTTSLDGDYTAFGDVFEGIEVVDTLAGTKAEAGSGAVAPENRPKIISVQILPGTAEVYGLKKR